MLEYFTYKKVKKHREEKVARERLEKEQEEAKAATVTDSTIPTIPTIVLEAQEVGLPVLNQEDEKFLERITSPEAGYTEAEAEAEDEEEGTPPPLPPRIQTPAISVGSDSESVLSKVSMDKGKGRASDSKIAGGENNLAEEQKPKRLSIFATVTRTMTLRRKPRQDSGLASPASVALPEEEVQKEEMDISKVLHDLDLSAQNNRAFSLSAESSEMARKFTVVLKDVVNGVPTAYGDLVHLLEEGDGTLARNYEKLPKSLKKVVTTLPSKLTTSLAPELLAVAAEAQGLSAAEASAKGGLKSFMSPKSLQELITKPGAVVGMLKSIVNVLKTRWPAFIGTNVLWSVAIFLLLSVLWYCHKRGREVRLEQEAAAADAKEDPIDGARRVEELADDPQLTAPRFLHAR